MNVFVVGQGADTGGQAFRIQQAVNRYLDGWKARSMCQLVNYMRYPRDMAWDREEARRMYEWCDVMQMQGSTATYRLVDDGERKPCVVHHQGTRFRSNPIGVWREGSSIGARQIVSTLDLLEVAPGGMAWLPSPYELDEVRDKYLVQKPRRTVRIVHSPTNRRVKGTAHVIAAVEELSKDHDVELDLVEHVEHAVCLSRKGRADIYIDQFELGYGNNAVEAWAMGIPVVAGATFKHTRRRMLAEFEELPFYESSPESLTADLARLVESAELRREWGDRGRSHAEKFHAAPVVAERLREIYSNAKRTKGAAAAYVAPKLAVAK